MKCVLVAPYQELQELAESLKREHRWDLEVVLGDLYEGVELARRFEQEGARVIISRGGTYQLIKRAVRIPVVEIKVSPEDLLDDFLAAKVRRKRLALAGFPNVIEKSYNVLTRISDGPIEFIAYDDPRCVPRLLEEAAKRGVDVFFTDVVGGRAASELGLERKLIRSGRQAVIEAVEFAMLLADRTPVPQVAGRSSWRARPRDLLGGQVDIPRARHTFDDIVYSGERMHRVIEDARRAAQTNLPVLITGETGTGKELFAHAIHSSSRRKDGPFVVLPCGAIPSELFVSETMGYSEGAFTGATRSGRVGLLETADGGTVFMDDVQDLPPETQGVLLRFLQEGEIRRLGDSRTKKIDVRVIAATNQNLLQLVKAGRFRKDLYYRLSILTVTIPPLRERPEDVPVLAEHFLRIHAARMGKRITSFEPGACALLRVYPFPGNVRELDALVLRAVSACDGPTITENLIARLLDDVRDEEGVTGRSQPGEAFRPGAETTEQQSHSVGDFPSLRAMERQLIERALILASGNMTEAARMLGISRTTLWRKLRGRRGPATL